MRTSEPSRLTIMYILHLADNTIASLLPDRHSDYRYTLQVTKSRTEFVRTLFAVSARKRRQPRSEKLIRLTNLLWKRSERLRLEEISCYFVRKLFDVAKCRGSHYLTSVYFGAPPGTASPILVVNGISASEGSIIL